MKAVKKKTKKIAKALEPVKKKTKIKHIHPKIHPEKYFLVIDGSTIKDLYQLADAFDRMSDDVFFYHVNEFRNDFENWLRDVFEEHDLADEMKFIKNVERAQIVVLRHIIKKLKDMV